MSRGVRGFVFEIISRNISMLRLAARAQGDANDAGDRVLLHEDGKAVGPVRLAGLNQGSLRELSEREIGTFLDAAGL